MRSGRNQYTHPWTEAERRRLVDDYPSLFPEEYAAHFPGRSTGSIANMAAQMGLLAVSRRVRYPRDYMNDSDGNYVSGLVDGEGWFTIGVNQPSEERESYSPMFGVSLRADDAPIVRWLRSYFDRGQVHIIHRKSAPAHHGPMAAFTVGSIYDMASSVVPHFEKYPLRAKKKTNYILWKTGLEVIQSIRCHGWTNAKRQEVRTIREELLALGKYKER